MKPSREFSSPLEEFETRFVRPAQGRALIVGSRIYGGRKDRRKLYAEALGIDMLEGDGVDLVHDLEEPAPDGIGHFSHVECMSVLEHSRRPWMLAANLERLMQPGATIFVTAPFVWRVHSYPGDFFRYTADGIAALFAGIEWKHLMYAHRKLSPKPLVPATMVDGLPYMLRTEVCGFGVKA